MNTSPPTAAAIGCVITMALLLSAHLGLWPYQHRLHRVANYTIGVSCILIGFTVTCALLDAWLYAVLAWGHAGAGGVVIAVAWWVRGMKRASSALAAHQALEGDRHVAAGGPDARRN